MHINSRRILLKISLHGINEKKKNNEALWIRTCDHLNAKVWLRDSYRRNRLRHGMVNCMLLYS